MYLNIYFDTEPTVPIMKFGSYDIGSNSLCYWIVSLEGDKNAMHILEYNNEEWLISFQAYKDDEVDPESVYAKFIKKFKATPDLTKDADKKYVFAYTKNPKLLFEKIKYEFDEGLFLLIKLEDKFYSPGYQWETDGKYDKDNYGPNSVTESEMRDELKKEKVIEESESEEEKEEDESEEEKEEDESESEEEDED